MRALNALALCGTPKLPGDLVPVIQHEGEARAHTEACLLCGHVPKVTGLGGRREVDMDPRHLLLDEIFEEYCREDVICRS